MQNLTEARRYTINALDNSYNEIRDLVDDLVKKSNDRDNMSLVQMKLNNLGI